MSSEKFSSWRHSVKESLLGKSLPKETDFSFTQSLYGTTLHSLENQMNELHGINVEKQRKRCIGLFEATYCKFERNVLHNESTGNVGSEAYEEAKHILEGEVEWRRDSEVDEDIWKSTKDDFNTLMVSYNFRHIQDIASVYTNH